MSKKLLAVLLLLIAVPSVQLAAFAQTKQRPRRAKLPTFSDRDIDGIFFKDIHKDGFVGERPDFSKVRKTGPATPMGDPMPSGDGGIYNWSQIISATTIEDEVKAAKLKIDQAVTTPTVFQSRGYKQARKHFSMLAMMFGIVGEYDGDVRWKKEGPGARDLLARAAGNCKVGSTAAYNEAKQRKDDLQDLVSGGAALAGKGDPKAKWDTVVDRSPLMQRLEAAHQGNLQQMTANEKEFKANIEKVLHEAEIVAVIADVMAKEGMPDADDDDYKQFSVNMKKAARDIADAVKTNDHESARTASGVIGQACTQCHELYRG